MIDGKTRTAVGSLILLLLPLACRNPGSSEVDRACRQPFERDDAGKRHRARAKDPVKLGDPDGSVVEDESTTKTP